MIWRYERNNKMTDNDKDDEKIDDEKKEEWKVGGFERFIVRVPPSGNLNIGGKVVEARVDPKLGVAQLKEYYHCNGWGGACRECGLCPLIGHVDRVENSDKIKLKEEDVDMAYSNFGDEGLRNMLMQLKFPHNFSGPIYIPLYAEEYICARVSEGMVEITGFDLTNNTCFECYWSIDEFFFMKSDKHIEFWLDGLIKKQVLIGLIRYARCLMRS